MTTVVGSAGYARRVASPDGTWDLSPPTGPDAAPPATEWCSVPTALRRDEVGEHRLHLVDVHALGELLLDGHRIARDPDLQFRIEIERSGRLDGEVGDRLVEDTVVLGLATGDALLVDENQPPTQRNPM